MKKINHLGEIASINYLSPPPSPLRKPEALTRTTIPSFAIGILDLSV